MKKAGDKLINKNGKHDTIGRQHIQVWFQFNFIKEEIQISS